MSVSALPSSGGRRSVELGGWIAAIGVFAALAIGMAFGFPTPPQRLLGTAVIAALAMFLAGVWPFGALQVVFASSIVLISWVVTGTRSVNPIDLFLFPVLAVTLFGSRRAIVRAQDALGAPGVNPAIHVATHRLTRWVLAFIGVAVLSLVAVAARGKLGHALDSSLNLIRGCQGLAFYALGIHWIRTEREIRVTERTMQAAGWVLIALNLWYLLTMHIARAGMGWVVNDPSWPMTSANEAAISLLMVWVIVQPRRGTSPSPMRLVLMAMLLVMLVMTRSRSGLLAWTIYNLLTVRWWRVQNVLGALVVVVAAVLLAPGSYWTRMQHTLNMEHGSFEAYTAIIRVYSWQTAFTTFLHNLPIGVGYLGFRFESANYNGLSVMLGQAEDYYLEIAAGMGLPGVVTMVGALLMWWRLGKVVRDSTPPGSHGHELARRHGPLMLALLVANITADNFIGLTGLSQIALWTALLVRAGQLSAAQTLVTP